MLEFLSRRLAAALVTLALATVVVFAVVEVLPGDPALVMLGTDARPDTLAALRAKHGFDQPLLTRYLAWIGGLLTFELGNSHAYGASESAVLFRHALRNALIPVTTVAGLIAGFLVAGAVIIESVFRLPGVGQLVYDSINNRDLIVIKNVVILFTILVLLVNLLVDLAYVLLDPRPRVAA